MKQFLLLARGYQDDLLNMIDTYDSYEEALSKVDISDSSNYVYRMNGKVYTTPIVYMIDEIAYNWYGIVDLNTLKQEK